MKSILIITLSLFGLSAVAAVGYGEAGCGLGSIVMGKDGNQVLASTTNSSSLTNYFGNVYSKCFANNVYICGHTAT